MIIYPGIYIYNYITIRFMEIFHVNIIPFPHMTYTPRKHCGWFWDLHTQMLHVWNIYPHLSILYMEHMGHIWNTKKMFDCLLINNVCFPRLFDLRCVCGVHLFISKPVERC